MAFAGWGSCLEVWEFTFVWNSCDFDFLLFVVIASDCIYYYQEGN